MMVNIFSLTARRRLLTLLAMCGVICMGGALLFLYQSVNVMREHEQRREMALQVILELTHTMRTLTFVAREGVVLARPDAIEAFRGLQDVRAGRAPRSRQSLAAPGRRVSYVQLIEESGIDGEEGARLRAACEQAEALAAEELRALRAALALGAERMGDSRRNKDAQKVIDAVFGEEHRKQVECVQNTINSAASTFINRLGAREDGLQSRIVFLLIAICGIFVLTSACIVGLNRLQETGARNQKNLPLLYTGTLLALIVSLAIPIWLVYVDARTLTMDALERRQTAVCQEVYRELQLRATQVRSEARVAAMLPWVREFLHESGAAGPSFSANKNATYVLDKMVQNYTDVGNALLYDSQGNALASTRRDLPLSRQQIPHAGLMARVLRGEAFFSVGAGPFARQQTMMALAPVYGNEDGRGPVIGAVMLVMDRERGFRLWEDRISAEERMNIYVIESTGESIISSRSVDYPGQKTTALQALEVMRKSGPGLHYYEDEQGVARLGVFMPMPDLGGMVVVTSAYDTVASSVSSMLVRALIFGMAAVLLAIIIFSQLVRHMTRNLRKVNESLNNLIANAGVHTWALDMAQDTFSYGPSWHKCMRMPGAPQAGTCSRQEWLHRVHPDDLSAVACLTGKNAQGTYLNFEARFRDWEEGWHWLRVQACVEACDMDRQPVRISAMALDITAQRTVEQTAGELQSANDRLEEVINTAEMYTVDYDLAQSTFTHNAQWCRFWRWPGPALPGEKVYAVIAARFSPATQKNIGTMLAYAAEGDTFSVDMHMRTWDDVWRWSRFTGRFARNEQGDGLRLIGTGLDISAQKNLEQSEAEQRQLAQSLQVVNARMDELIAAANMFTYDIDFARGEFEHNAQWCLFWQYPGEPAAGVKPTSFVLERADPASVEKIRAIAATGQMGDTFSLDMKVTICSGEERWCRQIGRIVGVDVNGKPSRAVGTGYDITAEKTVQQSEAALREVAENLRVANERMRSTIESADMFTYELDLRTQEFSHSAQWCTFWQYPGPAEAGVKPLSFVIDHLHSDSARLFQSVLHGKELGDTFSMDLQATICTGETRWGRQAGRIEEVDEEGRPLRIIGTGHDITAWKTMEQSEAALRALSEELAAANARMDAMVEAGDMVMFDMNMAQGTFRHNAQWCRFWEYPGPAEAGVKPLSFIFEHVHPESRDIFMSMFSGKALGDKFSIEMQVVTCGGEVRWARQVGRVEAVDKDGKVLRIIGTTSDITAQKCLQFSEAEHKARLEEMVAVRTAELEESRNHAQAASQAKTMFLSTVSHEIRTPMNAIMGFTHIFDRSNLTGTQKEQLTKIRLAASTLLAVINDVLDISKIEAGKLELEVKPFHLQTLLDTVRSIVDFSAFEKGLALKVDIDEDVPRALLGDTQRIIQILLNLLNNAVKFTEKGQVLLSVRMETPADDEGHICLGFCVQDTGIGIAAEHLPRLFEPFTQADNSVTRRFGGTGLGLAISRQLVELMGGEIAASSELGLGSTFHFTLRLRVASAAESMELAAQCEPENGGLSPAGLHVAGLRILVVEDNEINQEIARALLEEYDFEVDVADNGQEALQSVITTRYDCIFMDMQMPVMGGIEAAGKMREVGYSAAAQGNTAHAWLASVPIIAMTANAMAEDRQRCLEAGMDDHIGKPIDPAVLRQRLHQWVEDVGKGRA